jgi:uncharacterized membrane protein YgdD (TMEM256/DUF423 family)
MDKWVLTITAVSGLAGGIGVGLAGVAAHGSYDPMLETGARLLTLHAIAALAVAALASNLLRYRNAFLAAAALLLVGGVLFCADLAARTLGSARLFPMAAPIGGSLLILGWAWLSLASVLASISKAR